MTRDEIKAYVAEKYTGLLTLLDTGRYDPMFQVEPQNLLAVMLKLRDDATLTLDCMCNMGGVDTKTQFEVVYNLCSIEKSIRLDVKLTLPYENAEVDSVQTVWPGANWYEREMWELYGINIKGHNNLTRFLLPDDWNQGHPMRKDWDAPDFIRFPEFNV